MPVKLETSYSNYPQGILDHLLKRIDERKLTKAQGAEIAAWLRTKPLVPDLNESPDGWYKKFTTFTVPGEGQFMKSVFTPSMAARGVNLDEWKTSL